MRAPATSGARVNHGQSRKPAAKRAAAKPASRKAPARKPSARKRAEPEIKVTRNSKRPQIKASRGPGSTAQRQSAGKSRRIADRAAETRRQSLNSLNADYASPRSSSRSRGSSSPSGGSSMRAVAVGAGGAAVGAVRVASEVARPAAAAARPMLQVITGGLDKLPSGAGAKPYARGRIMIMIAAVLGAGLIYINVGKLQAGDGYGKYAARSAELQRENTALRAKVADLSSVERIQTYAKRFGMVSPLPEQYKYLRAKQGDAVKGSKGYVAPTTTGASPTAAPNQQASTTVPTNETDVSGTATTTPAETPVQAPVSTEQVTPDPATTAVGGAQ